MLHFLDHRNQNKNSTRVGSGYFVLLDKLQGTLKNRIGIESWTKVGRLGLVEQHKVAKAVAVADVMAFLHEWVILVCDLNLKPGNVGFKVNEEEMLKIFDLGMAVELDSYKILHMNMNMKLVLYPTSWPRKLTLTMLLLLVLVLAMAMSMFYFYLLLLMSTPSASCYGRSTSSRYHMARYRRKRTSRKCSERATSLRWRWRIFSHRKSRASDCCGKGLVRRSEDEEEAKNRRLKGSPEHSCVNCERQSPSLLSKVRNTLNF